MTGAGNPRNLWLATALAFSLIAVAAVTAILLKHRPAKPAENDCRIVGELVQQWQSTVHQGQSWLEKRFGGDAEMLTVTDAEDAVAAEIRARIPQITSASIAADLSLWADGIEKMARSQRSEVKNPRPDRDAPPPEDYIQGSLASDRAGAGLLKACPSAMGTSDLA